MVGLDRRAVDRDQQPSRTASRASSALRRVCTSRTRGSSPVAAGVVAGRGAARSSMADAQSDGRQSAGSMTGGTVSDGGASGTVVGAPMPRRRRAGRRRPDRSGWSSAQARSAACWSAPASGVGLGGQAGLRFGFVGSSLVSSASRRCASASLVGLDALLDPVLRDRGELVEAASRWSPGRSDRSTPAIWPGTPRKIGELTLLGGADVVLLLGVRASRPRDRHRG